MSDVLVDTYRRNAQQAERYACSANSEEERAAWQRASKSWRDLENTTARYQRVNGRQEAGSIFDAALN